MGEQRDKIKAMLGDKKAENAEVRDAVKKMQGALRYTNEEDVNKRLAEIDKKMHHSSLSLKEEKDLMKEMQELKRSKPKLAQLSQAKDRVSNFDAGTDLKAKKDELNEQFGILREKKKGIQERLGALNEERQAKTGDSGPIIQER